MTSPSRVRRFQVAAVLLAFASWSASIAAQDAPQGLDGWAWRPLQRPEVPAVRDASWPRSPVDHFVLARLEQHGLRPAPKADPVALLRRVTHDLTGLPPTGEALAAFTADPTPAAYERAVDALLASPQYGVRWGRHWLDLVRYADTDGYERDRSKPFVWRYRDWVVDALNADLPYGAFLHAQLAGDEKPEPTTADLIATGYYRLGIWDDEPTDPLQTRYDDLDGIADTTARAMLGVSMGCARCHDHKKDPLPTRDYYAFLAFFENIKPPDFQSRQVPKDGARQRYEQAVQQWQAQRHGLVTRLVAAADQTFRQLRPGDRVAALATAERSVVARYRGERTSPGTLYDDLDQHHGVVRGQVVVVPGRSGSGFGFDGDDRIELPRLVQDDFTVSFWVRSDRRGRGSANDTRWFTGDGLVDGEVPGVVSDWGISWHSDGRIVAGAGAPETFLASPPGYHDGQWHHVAFTRERRSGRIALHVDGTVVGTATGGTQALDAPPKLVVGGLQPGGHGFRGELDELCFHDRALSPEEIVALALELRGGTALPGIWRRSGAGTDEDPLAMARALAALQPPVVETIEVLCVQEHGRKGPDGFVRQRGNVHSKGARVEPGFPAMLGGGTPVVEPAPKGIASSGRRTALARWITRPDHPSTWRVVANRLWQYHFGRGLCRSSNDFGLLGEAPTHPELIDWLATELLVRGQSLKAMHKLLVTSASYQMAALVPGEHAARGHEADPRNDWFWRFDRRRLTAEEVRDAMLWCNGTLNLELGGPGVYPPLPAAVLATASRPDEAWGRSSPEQAARRSLYVFQKRSLQEPLLAAFDQADTDNSCPVRFATVQPTQALILLNGDFAQRQATAFAQFLTAAAPDLGARLALGLERVTGRAARQDDLARLLALAAELQREFGKTDLEALQRCCLLLLNCNEFLYLD